MELATGPLSSKVTYVADPLAIAPRISYPRPPTYSPPPERAISLRATYPRHISISPLSDAPCLKRLHSRERGRDGRSARRTVARRRISMPDKTENNTVRLHRVLATKPEKV